MASRFCGRCEPEDMPEPPPGRWVDAAAHEHQFESMRPTVYLSDPGSERPWVAYLPVTFDYPIVCPWEGGWLGQRSFPTQAEAMEYAVTLHRDQDELVALLLKLEADFLEGIS